MKTRRKLENRLIRKITKIAGGTSYGITLPIDVVRCWKWKEKQKLILEIDEKNKVIKIRDWCKKVKK